MPVTHGVRGSSPLRTASKPERKSLEIKNRKRGSLRLPRFSFPRIAWQCGRVKARQTRGIDEHKGRGTPAGTRESLTPERKAPRTPYPTAPGKGNNRMLRRIRPATPERKNIRRREAGKQRTGREGAGNSTPAGRHASGGGTAGHGRQTAKKISRNYLQVLENIVSLHSQYQNGALVQLVRIRACHARGQGFESPTHRQQTGEEIFGDKKQETRQFTTASFFVSPHRMAVRMGKGEADKGTIGEHKGTLPEREGKPAACLPCKTGTRNETFGEAPTYL